MGSEKCDVIFVIEKSIEFKKYLRGATGMLDLYINPIMSYFSNGANEDTDIFFFQNTTIRYATVYFGTEMNLFHNLGQIETFGPTLSTKDILNSIQTAYYHCNNMTRQAFILEGINSAINIFKAIQQNASSNDGVKRCCVLVTQSEPIVCPFSTVTFDGIVQNLKMYGIQLSIVSPHKIPELYTLFEESGGDSSVASSMKTYAVTSQHLVLLNGIQLPERSLSPTLASLVAAGGVPSTVPSLSSTASVGAINPPTSTINIQDPAPSPGQQAAVGSPAPTITNQPMQPLSHGQPGPTSVPVNPIASVSATNPVAMNQMQTGVGAIPPNSANWTNSTRPCMGPAMRTTDPSAGGNGTGIVPMETQPAPAQPPNSIMFQNALYSQIWQGHLEYTEKNEPVALKRVRCTVFSTLLKNDGWATVLQLKFLQKQQFTALFQNDIKNSHILCCQFEDSPSSKSMKMYLSAGNIGCVFVSTTNSQNDKIMLFLFKDGMGIGFVPKNSNTNMKNKLMQLFSGGYGARKAVSAGMAQLQAGPGTLPTQQMQTVSSSGVGTTPVMSVQQGTSPLTQGAQQQQHSVLASQLVRGPVMSMQQQPHQAEQLMQMRPGQPNVRPQLQQNTMTQGPTMSLSMNQSMPGSQVRMMQQNPRMAEMRSYQQQRLQQQQQMLMMQQQQQQQQQQPQQQQGAIHPQMPPQQQQQVLGQQVMGQQVMGQQNLQPQMQDSNDYLDLL